MHNRFRIEDLGELKFFLGVEIAHSKSGIHICQKKFVLDLLVDAGFLESKPAETPMNSIYRLVKEGKPYDDINSYRRLIGKLSYLSISRPDIAFPVQ